MTVSVDLRKVPTAELRAELARREAKLVVRRERVARKKHNPNHPKGRPPEGAYKVERLTDDLEWIPDDGQPGIAFSGMDDKFPYNWSSYGHCNCDMTRFYQECPRQISSYHTAKRFGCSNGGEMVIPNESK